MHEMKLFSPKKVTARLDCILDNISASLGSKRCSNLAMLWIPKVYKVRAALKSPLLNLALACFLSFSARTINSAIISLSVVEKETPSASELFFATVDD